MRRRLLLATALFVALADLVPVALVVKQAVTTERETFAWPPTWVPHTPTLANLRAVVGAVEFWPGLALSAGVALATVVAALGLALPAAWLAVRSAYDRPLDIALLLTRLLPSLALAIPLAALFVGVGLYDHPAGVGLWLAHTLVALPVAFFVLRAGFRAVPVDLEEAARLDGASAAAIFVRVSLPLVRPALAAAGVLVFLVSWDEFAYALLLQVTHRPLPPLLYYFAAFGYPGMASALAVVMLVPALLVVVIVEPALRSGVLTGSNR